MEHGPTSKGGGGQVEVVAGVKLGVRVEGGDGWVLGRVNGLLMIVTIFVDSLDIKEVAEQIKEYKDTLLTTIQQDNEGKSPTSS